MRVGLTGFCRTRNNRANLMSNDRPVVLVTGASGFVGRHLVPVLARNGWAVRRAIRTPSANRDEVVIESIGPTTDWRAALADADAVVHLAARVHHPKDQHATALYRPANLHGTFH